MSKRLTDGIYIVVNGMPTSFGEMRGHAKGTLRDTPPLVHGSVVRGMAHAILFLLDEIERREVESSATDPR